MRKLFIVPLFLSMLGCSNVEEANKNDNLVRDTIIATFFYNYGDIIGTSKTKTKSKTRVASNTQSSTSTFENGSITTTQTRTKEKTTSKSVGTSFGIGFK